jgi:hypothetical protein
MHAHLSGTFLDGSQIQLSTAERSTPPRSSVAAATTSGCRCWTRPRWLFKTALIFDAFESDNEGRLSTLREFSGDAHSAIWLRGLRAGPAPQTPFRVDSIPEIAGLAMFGVRPIAGTLNLTINERRPDGRGIPGRPSALPIPGFLVMLGVLHAVISGRAFPLTPGSDQGFVSLWPTTAEPVTLTTVHAHTSRRSLLGSSGSTASRT